MDGLETAGAPARCEPARCEPAGHVRVREGDEMLVTTIHQAKGREWDVVIVGSLSGPDLDAGRVGASRSGPAGITSPSPGQATCWCSPPAASHRPGSTPPGEGAARWPCLDRDHRTGGVDAPTCTGIVAERTTDVTSNTGIYQTWNRCLGENACRLEHLRQRHRMALGDGRLLSP